MLFVDRSKPVEHRPSTNLPPLAAAPNAPVEDGWMEVRPRRSWRHRPKPPCRPPLSRRPVPSNLVGRCFNCFSGDHIAASCRNHTRCFRCKRTGHSSAHCKRSLSPIHEQVSATRGTLGVSPPQASHQSLGRVQPHSRLPSVVDSFQRKRDGPRARRIPFALMALQWVSTTTWQGKPRLPVSRHQPTWR